MPIDDAEWERLTAQLAASMREPFVDDTESLPEGGHLPDDEGETLAVFLSRKPSKPEPPAEF